MLFRLELVPERKGESLLGFDWIEILAVTPHWLSPREEGQWHVGHAFIVRTEHGPTVLAGDDVWPEVDGGVYREVKGSENE